MSRPSFFLALLCLPLVVGCEGCRRDSDPQADQDDAAPLEDFTARPPQAFPAGTSVVSGGIKPGHWITASQSLKSNKLDARGELHNRATTKVESFSTGVEQTSLGDVPTVRPVVLPKGQQRRFDYRILAPIPTPGEKKRSYLSSRFISSGRNVYFDTGGQPFNVLSGEEYFFVVLTNRPERFAKLQVSDWVRPYRDEFAFKESRVNYRIVFPPADDLLPLAETMLDWTGTAYVLWDDLSPDALTPQQQTAIADWVHFGGQLIVNGADAADAVSKTTLANLLPLQPTGNIELNADSAETLLRKWAVATDRSTEKQIALMRSQSGRIAVDGRVHGGAQAVEDSGNLVLQRAVGGGRVVQPRFDVTSDWLVNWESYDSFFNAVLLARPRRELIESTNPNEAVYIQQRYPDWGLSIADPAMNSRLRITARDAVLPTDQVGPNSAAGMTSQVDALTYVDAMTGVGGWTDESDVVRLCRDILRIESGIEIPDSSLVVKSLGYYLLILVPINYLVFRLLGRLEYAWLAVPVIAIVGAIWVARAARLDIGFARSHAEIGFLETQVGYNRAHLSRVVAIYNSLSRTYDIEFDSIHGAAAPVWGGATVPGSSDTLFKTGFGDGPILSGLAVGSNNVRMLHAEQMVDLGGPIRMDEQQQLINESAYELLDAVVIDRSADGDIRIAAVGICPGGSASKLRFRDLDAAIVSDEIPMRTARLMRRLAASSAMPKGSTRLVARVDGALEGMTITPAASQIVAQTIVLAHLKRPSLPRPKPDVNLIGDLRQVLRDDETKNEDGDNAVTTDVDY